jgi:hypothetical protein
MIGVKTINRRRSRAFAASALVATAATSLTLLLAPLATASPGAWELTGCSAEPEGTLRGTLRVHNQDTTKSHSYSARVIWSRGSDRLGSTDVRTGMIEPGQAQDIDASTGSPSATVGEAPAGPVSCTVEYIRDENDENMGS